MANSYSSAVNIIKEYIATIGESPAQRSAEWYDIRKFTIGGSEVATVLGLNPFESVKSLVAKKANLSSAFNGNTATRWGNLFESVTQQFTEKLLKMHVNIFVPGSVKGVVEGQRYSPDGIGVVRLLRDDDVKDNFIVLFEFKSPLRSIPLGAIPKHYVPQVQTGLLSIHIAEFAIFVNCCYRKCTLENLTFNSIYDVNFHDGDVKKCKTITDEEPYAIGVCCFYQTIEQYEQAVKACGYSPSNQVSQDDQFDQHDQINYEYNKYNKYNDAEVLLRSEIIDFGASNALVDDLLRLIDCKKIHVKYLPMSFNSNRVNSMKFTKTHKIKHETCVLDYIDLIGKFKEQCDIVPIGYMPWKLMKTDVLIENRIDNWLEKIKEPITETITIIKEINSSDDPLNTYQKIYNIASRELMDCSDF